VSRAARVARQLRRELALEVPVDVEAFAAALGMDLIEDELGPGVLGMTFVLRRRWLVVQRGLSPQERRQTVLHEGGHYLLHVGNGVYAARHDRYWGRKREREANEFAAVYGVPDELLGDCVHELELTEAAGLPLASVRLRLSLCDG
jgi:hypothetical protein